ncbi:MULTISPECIES: hypothetical protein [Niastella]|uniref:Glycosyltransferase RgtA/B/C/D-like domain-containing protein n=1 Tax=Niastella soli TaxID=2821487 RepID=A0ABS3Z1M8_9BACT|nr:hypothetical protein [Niastella soli]MBO9203667.1 hypothetical protein [Niastella soli]
MTGLKRKDIYLLSFLFLVVLLIFYPLFFTEYAYTDETDQLWNYRPGSNYRMFGIQGRWITEWMVSKSFAAIDSIREITFIRIFSLAMWLVCIPVWYVIIKRVVAKDAVYEYLPFFTCLFLVTSLQFSIIVQWASCVEMAIANTAGLLSGAIWYLAIRDKENFWSVPVRPALGAIVAGLISLFAYQSGVGCFVIPFLLHYICAFSTRKDAVFIKGIAFYFALYALYFVLFKLSLVIAHLGSDPRSGITKDPLGKITYFIAQPLERSFWFNIIVNEDRKLSWFVGKAMMLAWMVLAFIRFGKKNRGLAVKHIAFAGMALVLSFLVSMVVKENYPSNRTMVALDLCVFIICAEMVLYLVKNKQARLAIAGIVAGILIVSSWYNFNKVFLQPVHKEYMAVKNYVHQHYNKNITTVYFIMSSREAFKKEFHIQATMDEFGVPSTSSAFIWVPEPLTRQLVYEKTGNRETAKQLTIKYWKDEAAFTNSGERVTDSTLVVNMPALIEAINP